MKHVMALLVRIVNYGARLGLCPGLSFKPPTVRVNNLKTEDLSPEQLAALMEAINQDHDEQARNFMRLALCTGMRRGELFQLQWQDVDFERGYITIRGPKGGRDQIIPLNLRPGRSWKITPGFRISFSPDAAGNSGFTLTGQ